MIEASHGQQQIIASSAILGSDSDPVLKSAGVLSDQIALSAELAIVSQEFLRPTWFSITLPKVAHKHLSRRAAAIPILRTFLNPVLPWGTREIQEPMINRRQPLVSK